MIFVFWIAITFRVLGVIKSSEYLHDIVVVHTPRDLLKSEEFSGISWLVVSLPV